MSEHALWALAATVALGACDPSARGPTEPADSRESASLSVGDGVLYGSAGFAVFPLQLRAADDGATSAWGQMVVRVGTRYPPSPCTDDSAVDGDAALSFCGVVHLPDGETVNGAAFALSFGPDSDIVTVRVSFAYPPSPCPTARLGGRVSLGTGLAVPSGLEAEVSTTGGLLRSVQGEAAGGAEPTFPPSPCDLTAQTTRG